MAAIYFLIGILFSGPLAKLLGATKSVYDMSSVYLRVILVFAPMFMMNNLLLCYVRNDGAPQLSMMAMLGGMGIFGAAFATGLAPVISILILSPFFIKKLNNFKLVKTKLVDRHILDIVSSGLPSLVTEVSSGIVMIIFNMIILNLAGNTGVAAYGVIANLSLVVISIYTGISQGIQPLLSSGYGSGQIKKVHIIFKYAIFSVVIISICIYLIIFFKCDVIAGIFNSENNIALQNIAENGLKIYFVGCLFAGINIVSSIYFTSIEHPLPAHVISLLRGFIIIIPMAFFLSLIANMNGVWATFPVTEFIVSTISVILIKVTSKKMMKM